MFSSTTLVGIALVVGQAGVSNAQADATANTSDDSKHWLLVGDAWNIFTDEIRKFDFSIGHGWSIVWPDGPGTLS